MINQDLLRGYYSGSGIKIALIDSGVNYDILSNEEREFRDVYYKEKNINVDEECDHNSHGTICYRMIKEVAPSSVVIDLRTKLKNNISIESVVDAIQYAVKLKCDVINMSIGFPNYSKLLYNACMHAYNNDIIIVTASGKGDEFSFPADNCEYTIKVKESNEPQNIILSNHDGEYAVKYEDDLISKQKNLMVEKGSSIACAFLSGLVALYLESRPLYSRRKIKEELLGHSNKVKSKNERITSPPKNSIVLPLSSDIEIDKYSAILDKNINGQYNYMKKSIKWIDGRKRICDNIYIVNPLHYPRVLLNGLSIKETVYTGEFNNTDAYSGKKLKEGTYLFDIHTPVVAICGPTCNSNKFLVHLEVAQKMKKDGINCLCVTYNALGTLFSMDYLKYPAEESYQHIVTSINNYFQTNEDKGIYDCFLISIGGGMGLINNAKLNDFGVLFRAYMDALPIDTLIITLSDITRLYDVEKKINIVKTAYSDIDISLVLYLDDSLKPSDILEEDTIRKCSVFNKEQVISGILNEHIYSSLR